MKWLKAILAGMIGSLIMFIIMILGINVTGFAPFNLPPSAAFLVSLDFYAGPLPLIVHFGYGAFWSVVLLAIFKEQTTTGKGLGLAMVLWLILMVIYGPIIGWGFFGFGSEQLASTDQLYLGSAPKYLIVTLLLHVVYGLIIGWVNKVWAAIDFE